MQRMARAVHEGSLLAARETPGLERERLGRGRPVSGESYVADEELYATGEAGQHIGRPGPRQPWPARL